tara:strand:- start:6383 stop:7711 length:1329 start_codon:yes stop_codon:yes gene_type:complete
MKKILIVNGSVVNENMTEVLDILIVDGKIERIDKDLQSTTADIVIDASGKYIIPGMIDDQVHFRDPGQTNKGTMKSESIAAVVGGTTSFMDMPNNKPPFTKNSDLSKKFSIAENNSLANFSFYLGATNENIDEIKRLRDDACGVKVFMGSSTGNMLVDDLNTLENIFMHAPSLIATHCESSPIIDKNYEKYKEKYGEDIPIEYHPEIRSRESCYESSLLATNLAKKHNSRLHVLHLTTKDELSLFSLGDLKDKKITGEVCVHHLLYSDKDYEKKGTFIKCNPSIKTEDDRKSLVEAIKNDNLDVIATDHAPHLLSEKTGKYIDIGSGLPYIQHALRGVLEFYHDEIFTLEKIVEKISHNPAICYSIKDRGFLREGYWADIVIFEKHSPYLDEESIYHKCGWSAFSDINFRSKILYTIVSGNIVYDNGNVDYSVFGKKLEFNR